MKLNPSWLSAAVVLDTNGIRLGTVGKVDGDNITYYVRGVPHAASAKSLDGAMRLVKPHAVDNKYL